MYIHFLDNGKIYKYPIFTWKVIAIYYTNAVQRIYLQSTMKIVAAHTPKNNVWMCVNLHLWCVNIDHYSIFEALY